MNELLQHLANGLILGSTLCAAWHRPDPDLRHPAVFNDEFCHGELYAFGGYFVYFSCRMLGFNFFLSLLIAILAGCILGALIERVIMLHLMRGRYRHTTMIIMIGAMDRDAEHQQYVTGVA